MDLTDNRIHSAIIGRNEKTNERELFEKLDSEIIDEIIVWRLVLDKAITYSEIENLNFIDALKLNAILDFRNDLELQKQKELESKNSYGNQS